jgi:pseudaminic acid cytidylyltransferase
METQSKGCVAIITARGGSKRIPRKNLRNFLGQPIVGYSIQSALNAGVFDEVMVSTDDSEIAEVANKFGAKVPFLRSAATSDDYATTAQVLIEVLETYREHGLNWKSYCCIYPTAPFVTPEKLRSGYELLDSNQAHSVLPVVRFGYPIQRALQVKGGLLSMIDPSNINARSQDLMPTYHDCGQFYFGQTENLLKTGQIFSTHTLPIIVPETEVQDIDHEEDWVIAELKYKLLLERASAQKQA